MDMKTNVALFEMRIRGMLAGMFYDRSREPTDEQWKMISGTQDITMRDLAVIAHKLGYDVRADIRPAASDRVIAESGV